MKPREKNILEYIIENNKVLMEDLLEKFHISKRTLYYDIESINYHIKNRGQIKNINRNFCYIGNFCSMQEILYGNDDYFHSNENRKKYVLANILDQELYTLEQLENKMLVSKNTVVKVMEDVKKDLRQQDLQLVKKEGAYIIRGKEDSIRNLFLMLLQEDNNLLNATSEKVLAFDRKYKLQLTDYALATLSRFLDFVEDRIKAGYVVDAMQDKVEAMNFSFYKYMSELIEEAHENEYIYLAAFISSLPSLNTKIEIPVIDEYVERLIYSFEMAYAMELESKNEFKKNIKRHLQTSYYRIKFHFPINNPSLKEVKLKHSSLFQIIKRILENEEYFPSFKGIREEEIGFIATYFGGYLKGSRSRGKRMNKILLVCPHGLMISKSLEVQLYRYIPTIEIVDTIALKDVKNFKAYYDYIVSTIDIPELKNVLVVNPIMTRMDIDFLINTLLEIPTYHMNVDIKELLVIIEKYCKIEDKNKLENEIEKLLYKKYKLLEKEMYQPMLKEIMSKERITVVKNVKDWRAAIRLASKPLLDDGSIEEEYVNAMIESVQAHGPYIVLADRFALPHASSASGVNAVSMALLVVKEEVDLEGKPVNLFMVLATTDNSSHMGALVSLTEILCDEKNISLFIDGDKDVIMDLIHGRK